MKSAIGTGKTYMFLLKIWAYCKQYPGTTGLIVRKEFTDLKDSTMRDFEKYFNVKIGSDKDYLMPNKSKIMFRHAAELDVLKNINLGIAGIEQGEEFEDDTQFQFIRDRMRQNNGANVHPICIIANANGHNWIWKLWVNQAQEIKEIDIATGQFQYINGEYDCVTANTFANEHNLPKDFVEDLRRMEKEAPKHYAQFVMNSDEEMEQDDFVFNFAELNKAKNLQYAPREGYGHRVMGFDVARYGNDKCAAVGIQQIGATAFKVFHVEQWGDKSLSESGGRFQSIANQYNVEDKIIDADGMGSGPLDYILDNRETRGWQGFRNPPLSFEKNKHYANSRTAAAFKLKEYIEKGWISLTDEMLVQELMTLRYKFTNDGRRILVSKDEMRKLGIKSPNLADALIMAVSLIGEVKRKQDNYYYRPPQYSQDCNLFSTAGIR